MVRWLQELKEGSRYRIGQTALKQLARVGLAQVGNVMPESRAQTRYSETDSLEVLVLRSIQYDSEQKAGVLSVLSGKEIVLPLNLSALSGAEWRSGTKEVMILVGHSS